MPGLLNEELTEPKDLSPETNEGIRFAGTRRWSCLSHNEKGWTTIQDHCRGFLKAVV